MALFINKFLNVFDIEFVNVSIIVSGGPKLESIYFKKESGLFKVEPRFILIITKSRRKDYIIEIQHCHRFQAVSNSGEL